MNLTHTHNSLSIGNIPITQRRKATVYHVTQSCIYLYGNVHPYIQILIQETVQMPHYMSTRRLSSTLEGGKTCRHNQTQQTDLSTFMLMEMEELRVT